MVVGIVVCGFYESFTPLLLLFLFSFGKTKKYKVSRANKTNCGLFPNFMRVSADTPKEGFLCQTWVYCLAISISNLPLRNFLLNGSGNNHRIDEWLLQTGGFRREDFGEGTLLQWIKCYSLLVLWQTTTISGLGGPFTWNLRNDQVVGSTIKD